MITWWANRKERKEKVKGESKRWKVKVKVKVKIKEKVKVKVKEKVQVKVKEKVKVKVKEKVKVKVKVKVMTCGDEHRPIYWTRKYRYPYSFQLHSKNPLLLTMSNNSDTSIHSVAGMFPDLSEELDMMWFLGQSAPVVFEGPFYAYIHDVRAPTRLWLWYTHSDVSTRYKTIKYRA